jgi:glycine dehydrogenase subunit 1
MTLGVLRPPGDFGVDIAVGGGQPLGNRLDYGGPVVRLLRRTAGVPAPHPGRHRRRDDDADGRRGFVLTLQTREQHIRRERATSNITTAQTLNALAAIVYLSWLGRRGIVEIGELMLQRTAYARKALAAVEGVELLHEQPADPRVSPSASTPTSRRDRIAAPNEGRHPGYPLGAD